MKFPAKEREATIRELEKGSCFYVIERTAKEYITEFEKLNHLKSTEVDSESPKWELPPLSPASAEQMGFEGF